jgi:DNA glycosylase AlkZ-like
MSATKAPKTLTLRELNRATLARQLLLKRSPLSMMRALERVAGLQVQWNPAAFVGLWTRVETFGPRQLVRALTRRQVVKATLMRGTLHLVTARDYPTFVAATHGGAGSTIRRDLIARADTVAEHVRGHLGDRALTRREIFDWLAREHGVEEERTAAMLWEAIRVRGRIVHAPEAAMWRMPRSMTFVAFDAPAGEMPDPDLARTELVQRYLRAFGPSTRADISAWGGMRVRDIDGAIEQLEPVRRFVDEEGRELLDVPRAPLPAPDTPAPVRFLPRWDNVIQGHADRRRVVPDEHRGVGLAGTQTFLAHGVVAGSWSESAGKVSFEPFAPLPRRIRRELEDEAARLGAFIAAARG